MKGGGTMSRVRGTSVCASVLHRLLRRTYEKDLEDTRGHVAHADSRDSRFLTQSPLPHNAVTPTPIIVHKHKHTRTHAHTHTHTHTRTHTRMHKHTHAHAHTRAHACTRAHAHTRTWSLRYFHPRFGISRPPRRFSSRPQHCRNTAMCTLYIRKMRKIATANGVYARTCGPCRFAFNPRSYMISSAWTAGRPRR